MVVQPGEVTLVPTGLVIEVPDGHLLGIFARSSTPLKRGLMVANGVGVVDPDYSGPKDEIKIEVLNFTALARDHRPGRSARARGHPAVRPRGVGRSGRRPTDRPAEGSARRVDVAPRAVHM